jgi:hypothetical protein
MTRQTVYLRPVSKWRATSSTASPPTQPVVRRGRPAALSDARDGRHLSDTSGRGQIPCLSRRILDLADLRKRTARMAVPYRASAPQEFLSAITPLSSLGLIASGTADPIVASSNSARLHVGSTGRFWRKAVVKAGSRTKLSHAGWT